MATHQASIRHSPHAFMDLFAQNTAMMLLIDPREGSIVDANPAAVRFYGYPRETLCSMKIWGIDQLPSDDVSRKMRAANQGAENRRVFSHRLASGEVRTVEVYSSPIQTQGQDFLFSIIHDITDRRQAEKALEESEKRFRVLVEEAPVAIGISRNGVVLFANRAFREMLGYETAGDLVGRPVVEHWAPELRAMIENRVQNRALGVPDTSPFEGVVIRKDGSSLPVEVAVTTIDLPDGEATVGFLADISERRNVEQALRKSERQFSSAFEEAAIGMALVSPEGHWLKVNRALCQIAGYSAEELCGLKFQDITHPDDLNEDLDSARRLLAGEIESYQMEKRYFHKDGHTVWIHLSVSLLRDDHGQPLHFITQVHDITRRKQAAEDRAKAIEALKASEERFRAVVENSYDGILFADAKANILYRSPSFCRITGYTDEESVGHSGFEKTHPDDVGALRQQWESMIQNPSIHLRVEYRVSHKDHTWRWIESSAENLLGNEHIKAVVVTSRDVTERRRAEEERAKAIETSIAREKEFRALFEQASDAIFLLNPVNHSSHVIVDANRAACESSGYRREELIGRPIADLNDEANKALIAERVRLIAKGERVIFETVHQRKDGSLYPLEVSAQLVERAGQSPLVFSIERDITERKRAEERLRESEEKWRSIVNASPDAILTVSLDGIIQQASARILELWGFDPERDVVGHSVFEFIEPADHERARSVFAGVIGSQGHSSTQFTSRRKDGKRLVLEVDREVLRNSLGMPTGMVVVLRDITVRVAMESQLRQAQKMESVGRLAGGVAHDFNNHLHVILGYAEIAMASLSPDVRPYKELQQIADAARRSADLTRQLLAFARKQDVVPHVLNLNDTVARTLTMLRRLIGEDIQLVWKPGQDLWYVKMDPAQVDQILTNLATNSRDAMAGAGAVTVATSNVTLDETWCQAHLGWLAGQYVLLSVSDTGKGMSREVLEHVFEPFFTTKDVGLGTGLGLATVYGIVTQNNGFVDVHSQVGSGTTFSIYLPRTPDARKDVREDVEGTTPRGHETVLIVEDEENILRLAEGFLEHLGYTVFAVSTPGAALAFAQNHKGPLDLLLTDVVMPELNGRELHSRLSILRPGLRVLFMSGYTADLISQRGVVEQGTGFLHKPFTMRALASKVREVIDAP